MEKFNFNLWLFRLFKNNHYLVILGLVTLITSGILLSFLLKPSGFPNININEVVITTTFPGASPLEVESTLTDKLENAIKGQSYINQYTSNSYSGVSSINILLRTNANTETSVSSIENLINTVELPNGANKPIVFIPQTSGNQFVFAILKNGNNNRNFSYDNLLNYGNTLSTSIQNINGVENISLESDISPHVTVQYNQDELNNYGLTQSQLSSVISASLTEIPVGSIYENSSKSNFVVMPSVRSISDIENIQIFSAKTNSYVKLSQVATATEGYNASQSFNTVGVINNGKFITDQALIYGVTISSSQNILTVENELNNTINNLYSTNQLPNNLIIKNVYNEASSTKSQISEVVSSAIGGNISQLKSWGWIGWIFGGLWLLILALLLFINVRTALIGFLSIPLSFSFSLIYLYLTNTNLNTIVLFSFILVLGLIVDPAIVVLESIQRYKDLGYNGFDAGETAIKNIGGGVFMAVLTSIIVFIPFGVVTGFFGQIISYIPLTVLPALVASYFIPVIFLAYFGSLFMKGKNTTKDSKYKNTTNVSPDEENLWNVSKWIIKTNRYILSKIYLQILIVVLALSVPLLLSYFFFAKDLILPEQFSSQSTSQYIELSLTENQGTEYSVLQNDVNNLLNSINKNSSYISSYYFINQTDTSATIFISVKQDIPITSYTLADDIYSKELQKTLTGDLFISQIQDSPPALEYSISVNIYGNNLNDISNVAEKTKELALKLNGVNKVNISSSSLNQLEFTPNSQNAENSIIIGSELQSIYSKSQSLGNLTDTTLNSYIPVYLESSNSIPVNVQNPNSISLNYGKNYNVNLNSLGAIQNVTTNSSVISHFNGERYISVNIATTKNANILQIQNKIYSYWTSSRLKKYNLNTDSLNQLGSASDITKSFTQLGIAILISLFATYICFVLFFKSFLQPFIIVFAVPLTFIGIFPSLYFFNSGQLGFLEMLGILTLIGIVENVGIFVIDLANKKVINEGLSPKEAISLSTGIRFRPIFLTKITALSSLLPLAVISPLWRGLSVVVISGILVSGILSLFVTPILYVWFYKIRGVTEKVKTSRFIQLIIEK